jgi:transposase
VYKAAGHEARQVVEIIIKRCVKEYRLEIVQDETGKCSTASAPAGVKGRIQYGVSVKAQSAYMYAFQMIPYGRIEDYFRDQACIPISAGTIFNFHTEGYELLENFEAVAKANLCGASVEHSDETGINIGGKSHWIHNASNDKWTFYFPHQKRGTEALNEMGILPFFRGVSVHDHWLPYYTYKTCEHALCNAHHLRELEWVKEKFPTHTWAKEMQNFLRELNVTVDKAGGLLAAKEQQEQTARYQAILATADSESPPPAMPIPKEGEKKRRGKVKRTKERNLIERLREFKDDVLRFMKQKDVPFTNNQAERDLRMVKVQQKISGCFRSENGAKIFCRIRSYVLTCQKHGLAATAALAMLYNGRLPDFCSTAL